MQRAEMDHHVADTGGRTIVLHLDLHHLLLQLEGLGHRAGPVQRRRVVPDHRGQVEWLAIEASQFDRPPMVPNRVGQPAQVAEDHAAIAVQFAALRETPVRIHP